MLVTLVLTGDVMLGRLVNEFVFENPDRDSSYVWGDILPILKKADARFINLECVIAKSGKKWQRTAKVFHFRANPQAIESLKAAKIDFVSLANNHVLDYETEALFECLNLLDKAGVAHAGAGKNRQEAIKPAYLRVKYLSIGLISLTDNEPVWEAKEDKPGVNYVDYDEDGLREPYFSRIKRLVDEIKKRSDLVIVSAHVGPNWGEPSPAIKALAHQLIDLGVDIYWGHSNHTIQGVEIYRRKPILYSTGDFIDDYAVNFIERNDLSFLFVVKVKRKSIVKLLLYPVKIDNFQVNQASGEETGWLIDWIKKRCRPFDTTFSQIDNTLSLVIVDN